MKIIVAAAADRPAAHRRRRRRADTTGARLSDTWPGRADIPRRPGIPAVVGAEHGAVRVYVVPGHWYVETERAKLTDVAFVDKQIAKLEGLLPGSGSANTPTGLLPDGAQVTLRLADGGVTTMRVISDVAEIPESPEAGQEDETLSADSPLGLALVGH
jgi:hypothetical protein